MTLCVRYGRHPIATKISFELHGSILLVGYRAKGRLGYVTNIEVPGGEHGGSLINLPSAR